ncbi:hypothetical protein C0989_010427 [Termitomyces sp. Mn162]|nr:hypothetical protein C0989_010427 [Termitomyces sp. Mn162]
MPSQPSPKPVPKGHPCMLMMTIEPSPILTSLATLLSSLPYATALPETDPSPSNLCAPHSNAPQPHQNAPIPPQQPTGPRAPQLPFPTNSPHPPPVPMPNFPPTLTTLDPPPPENPLPLDGPRALLQAMQASPLAVDCQMADLPADGA